ncbi:MAG: 4Fe-4S binding protein, partial [Desulfovibrionaceae bacterium]|nr:4Fe-4S binding protein [Desulfovibrionaceae bacterium]
KRRTIAYPKAPPVLPERFRGRPTLDPSACKSGCESCLAVCPTGALAATASGPALDLGRCIFCGACERACPGGAVVFSRDHRLAARERRDLIAGSAPAPRLEALENARRKLFSGSLRLRQVSAAGCGACEADLNVLTTVVFDLGRFGIEFVASPRHADGLVITGPVSRNMLSALLATHEATPDPKIVVASGACAISGGLYAGLPETNDGASALVPVDLFIPGCPPHPATILDGLLRLLGLPTPD